MTGYRTPVRVDFRAFTADLLHDETAEIARLAEQVTALQTQVDALSMENAALQQDAAGHTVREQVWDWFRTGGPDDETTREQVAGQVCSQFLSLGSVEPGLVTAAAVALVESCPSGVSDAQVVAAAAACRQVITFAELTQASLTRELAWRYEARHDAEQALDLDDDTRSDDSSDGRDRVPDWVKDPAEIGLVAAVEEIAALARTSPTLLRERVEMLTTYADEHPVLHRARLDGQLTTGRARLIARETVRLPGARERAWVQTRILPVAERLGEAALRTRIETLIAQADPQRYRDLLDQAAAAADTVTTRQRGYGQAALTYQGSLARVAALQAALTHRATAADPDNQSQSATARDRRAVTAAAVLFDLVTDPTTTPPGHQDHLTADLAPVDTDPSGTDPVDDGPVHNDPVHDEPVGRPDHCRADCRRGDTRPGGTGRVCGSSRR